LILIAIYIIKMFQSTPPRGGRRMYVNKTIAQDIVSIHAPARGATDIQTVPSPPCYVSIHAPARGATRARHRHHRLRPVSIHAPARGATHYRLESGQSTVFQSTPPRGGRRTTDWSPVSPRCFNPRPRAGGDALQIGVRSVHGVSIHAPARGATRIYSPQVRSRQCFNPRPRAGGDGAPVRGTSPTFSFNPRPRAGGDMVDWKKYGITIVSIHAPARGATDAAILCFEEPMFQSTPPRGGRLRSALTTGDFTCFNPRPRAGGDV